MYILAILIAASLDSAPVVTRSILLRLSGSESASLVASVTTGRDTMPLNRWANDEIESVTVFTMSGWECPRTALICPDVKSRIALPSLS